VPFAELKDSSPPHHEEAEKFVLGAILQYTDEDAVDDTVTSLRPEDFYKGAHREIFRVIYALHDKKEPVDIRTVAIELEKTGSLERSGGASYIASLTSAVPTSANIGYYRGIVQELALRRRLIKVSSEITADAYDETKEALSVIEEAERKVLEIADTRQTGEYSSVHDLIFKTVDTIEKINNTQGTYSGIPSGFSDLDDLLDGFQNSEFIVIGARPGTGKTALALSMAANISIRQKKAVGFFSLEMSNQAIMQRLVASEARLNLRKIRFTKLKDSDLGNLSDAGSRIYDAPLYISDTPGMRLLDLRSQARRMKSKHGVQIIFIDYISLIQADRQYNIPRHEQIAEISRSLKALARELEIPLVVLSQIKRESEDKPTPGLSDIRESSAIEQDADVVLLLYRSRKKKEGEKDAAGKEEKEGPRDIEELTLEVAKQRNGPVDKVRLTFLRNFTRFQAYTKPQH
jgi:replicative DNA helicase